MKRLVCVLLALACLLAGCAEIVINPEQPITEASTTTAEPEEVMTVAPVEEKEPYVPSWAVNSTHMYAAGRYDESPALCFAPLDDLDSVRRIPAPARYSDKLIETLRVDRIDTQYIYLTAKMSKGYVRMRMALDTYLCEYLEESDALPEAAPPDSEPPVSAETLLRSYGYAWRPEGEGVPRPEYEFTLGFAKTPTHIFATCGGALYRMPLNDISKQEKIDLPGKFDRVGISGLTEQWLFASGGQTGENEYYPESTVTYRISLKTLKAEKIDEYKSDMFPRYNAASNSLLYVKNNTVEALWLDTSKRIALIDFSNYRGAEACTRGWVNLPGGAIALEILVGWWEGGLNCVVIDKDNAVRVADYTDLPGWAWEEEPEHVPNKAEQKLGKLDGINGYVTCGAYVYYVQATEEQIDEYYYVNNLYRMKIDGSDTKLLRAKTNIFDLFAVNGKLLCLAWVPEPGSEKFGFYALDENGKATKTIENGFYGEWADSYWERFGDLILFRLSAHGDSEDELYCIYQPLTSATFYAYIKEGDLP